MPFPIARTALLAASLLLGLPWIRSASTVPRQPDGGAKVPAAAGTYPSRVVVWSLDSPEYRALAIPKTYKSEPDAKLRLLVFRDGLCIRDRGLVQAHDTVDGGKTGSNIMQETGVIETATVASDGREAVVASTRYVSRVDLTPGTTSVVNDTVTGATKLTLVDPGHPDGRWQVTLENGRWVKDLLVLPDSKGVVVTTFLPRRGPSDLRILDGTGHETLRAPESAGETVRLESSPSGGHVAAEMAFPEGRSPFERGVTIFDIAHGTHWTYGWRYGTDAEPTSWTLLTGGVLSVTVADGTQKYDPNGRRL